MKLLIGSIVTLFIAGCSSVKKVEYPSDANPSGEITRLEEDYNKAVGDQHDVASPKEMKRVQKHLKEAKEEWSEKGSLEEFWEELGLARAYLNKSRDNFARRSSKVPDVLNARHIALEAGARSYKPSARELGELDESFKVNARELDKRRDDEVWNRMRDNYRKLEIITIQESQVGDVRELLRRARLRGARVYATDTLRNAQQALEEADRAIATNHDTPEAYASEVDRAHEWARILIAVNATSRRVAAQTNEEVAREIVTRNRAIANLNAELADAELEAHMTGEALVGASAANRGLRSEKEWNQALEEARQEFSEDEADVYRQGDKLLIRLKKMNFPTGSAEVPERSEKLLGKVSNVIEELNAEAVEVQGHTDSTGGAQINEKLSKERADTVADYLEDEVEDVEVKAVGYGYESPITSNKSPQGRAVNRRVDIVITPSRE